MRYCSLEMDLLSWGPCDGKGGGTAEHGVGGVCMIVCHNVRGGAKDLLSSYKRRGQAFLGAGVSTS